MSVRRTKLYDKFLLRISANATAMVDRAAIVTQGLLKEELSHAGSGRFYARHASTRAIATMPHFELTAEQVEHLRYQESLRFLNRQSRLQGARRNDIRRKNLRGIGVHQASRAGEPPAPDTGTLRRSVQVDVSRLQYQFARVGTNSNYAVGLEFGTRRVAARPWFRRTVAHNRRRIRAILTDAKALLGGLR